MEQDRERVAPEQETQITPSVSLASAEATPEIADAETAKVPVVTANQRVQAEPQGATDEAGETDAGVTETPTLRIPAVATAVAETRPETPRDDLADGDDLADVPTAHLPVVPVVSPKPPSQEHASQQERPLRFVWLRYPEFWLVVVLAAFIRLWHLDLTSFLGDQSMLMGLAREVWLKGQLPVTGIPLPSGALNSPVIVYALLPFAFFGPNPFPAIIALTLWNVLGVALCYSFTQRYFGRVIAGGATFLFATCGEAVLISHTLWQQSYLPPVLALWLITLYLGCIRGRRGWFAPHLALLALAIMLLPTAALLLPVSLVGLLLTPRSAKPRLREVALAVAVVIILLVPTLLWEVTSHGSDITAYLHALIHGSVFNLDVFPRFYTMLGVPPTEMLGPSSIYGLSGIWATIINIAAMLCFVAGWVVLTERLLRVGALLWRAGGGITAVWQGLREEPIFRAHLLLWLAVVVPMALLLWHTSAFSDADLLIIYPASFVVGGFAFQWAFRRAEKIATADKLSNQIARASILTVLTILVIAQAAQSLFYPLAIASGSFDAFTAYGYPLAEMQQLDGALSTLQNENSAHSVFISLPAQTRYSDPLAYLLVGEHPNRVGSSSDCLVLPAPTDEPALVVAMPPAGPANTLINSLPELTPVANLSLAGSADVAVYQMNGGLPPLLGEQALAPIAFTNAAGNGLRLDALAIEPDGKIRLRWTALGSATTTAGAAWYQITPWVQTASGARVQLPATSCRPSSWKAGETVFTWVDPGAKVTPQALMVQLGSSVMTASVHAGPWQVLTGSDQSPAPAVLHPSSSATMQVSWDGIVTLPLTNTP